MTVVTFPVAKSNKKVAALLSAGFTHSGIFDYVDTSLQALDSMGYGTHMQGWEKNDGAKRVMSFEEWQQEQE